MTQAGGTESLARGGRLCSDLRGSRTGQLREIPGQDSRSGRAQSTAGAAFRLPWSSGCEVTVAGEHIAYCCQKRARCYVCVVLLHRVLSNWHRLAPSLLPTRWSHSASFGLGRGIPCRRGERHRSLPMSHQAHSRPPESQRGDSCGRVSVAAERRDRDRGARLFPPSPLSANIY